MDATTVAVDLAKTVFELAIANAQRRVISRQRLNRTQFARYLAETSPTHVVMEACGMAHYWGRVAQQHGHREESIYGLLDVRSQGDAGIDARRAARGKIRREKRHG